MTKIASKDIVVVVDGGGARLFRNRGKDGDISLHEERRLSPTHLMDDGPSGSRPEEQTPRQTDEAMFAKQLTIELNRMHQGNEFDSLVLIADPQTLGQIRSVMNKSVEKVLTLSLAKDLTHQSTAEIAEAIIKGR